MKKQIIILLLIALFTFTGCSKNNVNKDINLNDMKNEDTSYLHINGKTLAFPFTLNDFFETFPEYDAYVSFDGVAAIFGGFGKMDLNQKVEEGAYVELKIIKKSGEEDEKTKLNRTRFYLKAFAPSKKDTSLGDSVVFDASYQYTEYYDFGIVKLNGIEINKTTIGEVEEFLKETYGDYRISSGDVICDTNITSKKMKGIEYLGVTRYPRIYVSIDGYSSNFKGTEIVDYVSVVYSEI